MKKTLSLILASVIFLLLGISSLAGTSKTPSIEPVDMFTENQTELDLQVKGAYLIEATSGAVLYSNEPFLESSPASVTKIMTLLLVCEALEDGLFKLTDTVSVSAYAASMGGSQVFLEEGERMTVEDLIKCTVIASANDAAVALSELVSGSEGAFVKKMNKKALELGLKNTSFENVTGLDDDTVNHYSCPRDIAIMSRELISHEIITKYSGMWQDSIRDGEFTLTNTTRLVRYYDGCNGLKTGSTDKAGFCVSASAKRGNMQLIAVVMGAPTRDERNEAARKLLDYGFSNFGLYERGEEYLESCEVISGKSDLVPLYTSPVSFIIEKSKLSGVELEYELPESLSAPINKGDKVGKVFYKYDGRLLFEADVYAGETVEKITVFEIFSRILKTLVLG